MDEIDKEKYIERYNNRLKKFGYDARTLGWGGGQERQILRFRKLMEIENFLEGKPVCSVLDVGCGFGDMGNYLRKTRPEIIYCGIDINPALIEEGLRQSPELDLRSDGILEFPDHCFDLVVESGMFNFKLEKEDNHKYIEAYLRKFYFTARLGVSADFMTSYVDFAAEGNFHLSPEKAYSMGKSISDNVIIRSDYLKYEFMMYLIKEH